MLQITPQTRILVALEAVDGRKGINSLVQLCREKLDADPFSGCLRLAIPKSHANCAKKVFAPTLFLVSGSQALFAITTRDGSLEPV